MNLVTLLPLVGATHEKSRVVAETNSQSVQAASWTMTDTELLSAMPKAVRVSVSVPRWLTPSAMLAWACSETWECSF